MSKHKTIITVEIDSFVHPTEMEEFKKVIAAEITEKFTPAVVRVSAERYINAKIEQKELKGNVAVSISDKEVRVWVCSEKGMCIFRFKAAGQVYKGEHDIIIMPRKE